ncbi:hypothetical protein N431DRAFT_562510 [Stipitochalara longipes BDJ]|nr:hypothetical protein N431DRAFT_562510 [Stipitochalara longipes BDJ]
MLETFHYAPLDASSNAIRLLTIHPADPSNPSVINCSLHQASLDDPPEYHALSYAWKDDSVDDPSNDSQCIIVDGRSLIVGCNLGAALQARRVRNDGHIPIWIDAICINQEDLSEKSHQILRMRQIYAQSSLVTVWLGPERDDSNKAFQIIRTISQLRENAKEWLTDSLTTRKHSIILDYGTFSLAPSYLRQSPWIDNSILQTLYKTGLAVSSDPRDKIYAILNLANDGAKLVPRPDYKLSAAEVFTQLVSRIIQTTNRLDVLSLASPTVYPRILGDELPTWVPDFSQRATSTINSSLSSLRPVSADGDSLAITSFNHMFSTLSVRGFVIDTVDGLTQVLCNKNSSHGDTLQQSKSKLTADSPSEATKAIDEITQTLIAGSIPPMTAPNKDILREIADRFVQDYRQFASDPKSQGCTTSAHYSDWFYYNQDFTVFGKSIKQWASEYNSPTISKISSDNFFDYRSSLHWYSRRLFTTGAGSVGLGGNMCRPGDIICILLGCSTPLVLRPTRDAIQLIGEAYLHGIMDGQAMKGLESGKYYMRNFNII